MSDHDCTGCWRYDAEQDTEECIVCGAVRASRGEVLPDGGQLVSEPDADLDALKTVTCIGCDASLPLTETARFARVSELDAGWLCGECNEQLCDHCDGRGWVEFPIAGVFDCPECADQEGSR